MLLDSNILIYAARDEWPHLFDFVRTHGTAVSAITRIEVYGYPGLSAEDAMSFDTLFNALDVHPVDEAIVEQAIALRQVRKISLGDCIIAATALCSANTLATRNVADFDWIDGLKIFNPIDGDG